MSQHAYELPAEGDELARLADEAAGGDVVYLTRGGRRIAAIVPVAAGAAGMAALEALEDADDERAAAQALVEWEADGFREPAENPAGDWRVIYRVEDERLVVVVVEVGHRREIYRER